jgi:hypothetical protein
MHGKPGKVGLFLVCILLCAAWIALGLKWIEDRPSPAYPFGRSGEFTLYAAVLLAYSLWFVRKLLRKDPKIGDLVR